MVNNLGEKRNNGAIIAALVSAFVFALAGLITGLALGLNKRERTKTEVGTARYLLVDAANDLNHTVSALRLCNRPETAQNLCNNGLVFAVRAETALECDNGDWADNRAKEAFLNDMATALHTNDPMKTVKKAEILFKYSDMFYNHVAYGNPFEYNGELEDASGSAASDEADGEADERTVAAAEEKIKSALGADSVKYDGSFSGRLEFELELGGKAGYATTEGERIIEFAFDHEGGNDGADVDGAGDIALRIAKECGYDGLSVCTTETVGGTVKVKLCKNIDGALACDECATVLVKDGAAVAFSAGRCDCEHKVPSPKVTEEKARRAAPKGARGEGVLVTRKVDGKERICYEYAYDLEDGVHYVYVCAESGDQMQVK